MFRSHSFNNFFCSYTVFSFCSNRFTMNFRYLVIFFQVAILRIDTELCIAVAPPRKWSLYILISYIYIYRLNLISQHWRRRRNILCRRWRASITSRLRYRRCFLTICRRRLKKTKSFFETKVHIHEYTGEKYPTLKGICLTPSRWTTLIRTVSILDAALKNSVEDAFPCRRMRTAYTWAGSCTRNQTVTMGRWSSDNTFYSSMRWMQPV